MKIKRLFNNNDIPQTIKNTWLVIVIVSVVNLISIFNIFESYVNDRNTVISLTEIKFNILQLTTQQQHKKKLSDAIELHLTKINAHSSWFNTSNLNEKNLLLMQDWHLIPINSSQVSFTQAAKLLNDFSASISSLQVEYELLSPKKEKLILFLSLFYLFFLFVSLLKMYYFTASKDLKTGMQQTQIDDYHAIKKEKALYEAELNSLTKMQNQIALKTQALEKANNTIRFLYLTSQQLSVVKLTSPILQQSLNDLAKHINLKSACLELKNGHFISSDLGCATVNKNYNRVAIIINNKPYGFLNYVSDNQTEEDHSLLESFTGLVARALYQQEYNVQENKLILMEERGIIARELHDSIAQSLSFMKIQSAILHRQLAKPGKEDLQETINNIDIAVSDAYKHLRSLLSTFRLNAPESNFRDALQTVIDTLQPQTTAKIKIQQFTCDFSTDASQHIHLLQIIREAIINAIKHAQSTRIDVSCIITSENHLWVSVIDNGIGLKSNNDNTMEEHYGLSIMKQRAAQLDANLTFTEHECGTEMKLIIPSNKPDCNQGKCHA